MDVDRIRQALLDLKAYGVGGHLCDYGVNEQDVIDVIDDLRKANCWLPIESAPRDEWVLVGPTKRMGICVAMNCSRDGWVTETRGEPDSIYTPTHWQPLPPPPSTPEKAE